MAQTPISPQTPYCTAADFVKRYDVRSIGDRLQDAGVRVTATNVLTDPNLAALLLQASGMVETACLRGQRYAIADLQALAAASPATTGGEFLKGLVADLTLWLIYSRRPGQLIPKPATDAVAMLEALAKGERIFGFQESTLAGLHIPSVAPDVNNPIAQILPVPLSTRTSDYFGDLTAG